MLTLQNSLAEVQRNLSRDRESAFPCKWPISRGARSAPACLDSEPVFQSFDPGKHGVHIGPEPNHRGAVVGLILAAVQQGLGVDSFAA